MKNKSFENIFNIIHFNSTKVDSYFNSLESLKKGLTIYFNKKNDIQNISQVCNWIKENIAISDTYFYGEFASFDYCLHSKSVINLEINFDSSNIYMESLDFDNINIFLNNDSLVKDKLEFSSSFYIVITLIETSIFQENFNFLLKKQSSNIPEFYKKHIISEILTEYDLKKKYVKFIQNETLDFDESLSIIDHICDNLELKSKIKDFKENKDILVILSALKRNYWDNSNI